MKYLRVKGMKGPDCAASVTKIVETAEGVKSVTVNWETGEVTYSEAKPVDCAKLKDSICKMGYTCEDI